MPRKTRRNPSPRGFVAALKDRAERIVATYPRAAKYTAITAAVLFLVTCGLMGYYYVTFSHLIDARLHGERDRVLPRVFARPLEIRRGDNVSQQELLDRLNDLGYAQRTQVENPGEFAVNGPLVSVVPRAGTHTGKTLIVSFQRAARAPARRTPAGGGDDQQSDRITVGRQAGSAASDDGRADVDGVDPRAGETTTGAACRRCHRGWCRR